MELSHFIQVVLSEQVPALPDLSVLRSARYLSWALVLAALSLLIGQRLSRPIRFGLATVLLVWTLIPGPVSPAFWLGLAFQMPSLMSTYIAVVVLVYFWRERTDQLADFRNNKYMQLAGLAGVLFGWLLLLDTFAVLPWTLYSFGFSPLALGVCVVLALLPWMFRSADSDARKLSGLLCLVLTVHVLLRLPTGNVWDALIDPWLWMVLQLGFVLRCASFVTAQWRGSKATLV